MSTNTNNNGAQRDSTRFVALFQKARGEVKAGKCHDALATLAALDTESLKPGMEGERAKLERYRKELSELD